MSNKYVVSGLGENCSAPVLAHLPNHLGFHLLRTTHASPENRSGSQACRPYYSLLYTYIPTYVPLLRTPYHSRLARSSHEPRLSSRWLRLPFYYGCLLLTTAYYLLPTTYYLQLATYNLQPTPCYSLLTRSGSHASRPLAPGCGGAVPLSTRESPPLSSAART